MTRRATRALLSVLVAAWWLVVPGTHGAHSAPADAPVALPREGRITDRAGAGGERHTVVVTALDRLHDAPRSQRSQLCVIYVICVRDFSGRYGPGPVTAAAPGPSDPGPSDPGPADPGAAVTDAAVTDATNGTYLILPVALVVGAGAVAAHAYTRRRRRARTRTTPGGGRWGGAASGGAGWGTPQGPPATPLAELDGQARRALVETDDAVRTSQEELGFATARFGEEAAKPFTGAVAYAQGELTAAFRLLQQLDDAIPEDDATRRAMLEEILRRCADADARLDAEAAGFDGLRALEHTAPEALAAVETAYGELSGRVASAQAALDTMRERYTESAAAPVSGAVEQARERLVFAAAAVDRARHHLDRGDGSAAAVQIRAAEGAVDQAARLFGAVDRRARELAEAVGGLAAALAATEADLADAHGLLQGTAADPPTADLRGRVGRAESVLADVRAAVGSGRYDPLDALRRVEEADTALDRALTGAGERAPDDRRARALLERAALTARSASGAAGDYVTTHRGAVGAEARTRLAEARRRLDRAATLATGDPRSALAEAQRADALARRAQDLAEQDVRQYGNPDGLGGAAGDPGSGGGGLGGAVLGGIILGGLVDDVRSDPGGGGFGGDFGGGPGSFGGSGTRGRLGGGR
ncbi:TPM domain-containing protein [Streptomyces sp. NPDC004267]|uniref:TPM domain-containing protein n=1 Tax=Streptomyces sp. NPDC004267 TaxID=3364694 RepID=UPI0036AB64EC